MHEQSETIQRPRGYYNVYGGTEYPIPKEFSFENQPYATQEQAVQSARWRSRMDAGHYVGASPSYGFSNSYQPSPQAQAFGAVLEALQDPRNQWMGTGMAGGTIRGLGGLRNFFADKAAAKAGGFNVPLSKIRKDMPLAKSEPAPLVEGGPQYTPPPQRTQYVNNLEDINNVARDMQYGNMLKSLQAKQTYNMFGPRLQEEVNQTMVGQQQLRDLNNRAMTQTEGPPPEMIRRLFGLKE